MRVGKDGLLCCLQKIPTFSLKYSVLCFLFLDVLTAAGIFCIVFAELSPFLPLFYFFFFLVVCFLYGTALILAEGPIPLSIISPKMFVFSSALSSFLLNLFFKLIFWSFSKHLHVLLSPCQLSSGNTVQMSWLPHILVKIISALRTSIYFSFFSSFFLSLLFSCFSFTGSSF